MTLFEYLSVIVSVVLSLSAARLISSVRSIMDRERRYWIHVGWAVQLLCGHVVLWWSFWSYRKVEAWSIGSFALLLLGPAAMYALSDMLVSEETRAAGSWREHFLRARGWFFGVMALLAVQMVVREWLVLGVPLLHASRLGIVIWLLVCWAGARSRSDRIHGGIVVFAMVGLLAMSLVRGEAGVIVPP